MTAPATKVWPIPATSGRRVIVIGAGGKLGLRLVARGLAHGHQMTAFVRDADRFAKAAANLGLLAVPTFQGDAFDEAALARTIEGHEVVVSAAGTAADGAVFAELFACVFGVATRTLPLPQRIWMVASTAALTIPHADVIVAELPGVPRMHRMHEADWRLMEASDADWSLMCPGPMFPAPDGRPGERLRISTDVVPFDVPSWAGRMPRIGLSLMMKRRLSDLTLSYEDVAEVMMANLADGGTYCRRRVGLARESAKVTGTATRTDCKAVA